MAIDRQTHPYGSTELQVVTAYYEKDRYLSGVLHTRQGWHWWFSATAPDGSTLSGQVHGPYASRKEALISARTAR